MAISPRKNRVDEARRLVKRSEQDQWRLAELTWEELEHGVEAKDWGKAIGYGERYISSLNRVWARYGDDHHRIVDRSFGEHVMLAERSPDSAESILDQAQAVEESTGQPMNVGTFLHKSPEQRVEEVKRALDDPEILDRIRSDRSARKVVARATGRISEDMEREARTRQRERAPRVADSSDAYNVAGDLTTARYRINRALKTLLQMGLDDESREMLLEHAEDVELSLGWFLSFLRSGDRSFDDQLEAVLREGRG